MKLGMSTACFYPMPVEEAIDQIAALGIRRAEVFFNTESEFSDPLLGEIERRLQAGGIEAVSVHPYTSGNEGILLFSEYARRTEDALDQYRRYFAAAQRLGAKFLTFHGERAVGPDTTEIAPRKFEVYRRLIDAAAEFGVTFTQENVAWCRSKDPAYLKVLREEVPELHYTLDIKQAHRAGHDWREFLDIIGDRLANVHINDFDVDHSCLLPGEGTMDYDTFFSRLSACGYDDQVMIEVYRRNFEKPEQVRAAIERLAGYAQI